MYATTNFMHMAIFLFIFCVLLCVGVSLATEKPSEEQLVGLTFGTLTAEQRASTRNSYNWVDIAMSALVIILVVSILAYFTG